MFNQTFAPLGYKNDKKNTNRPLGVVWHDTIAGCFAENIASTYVKVLNHRLYRDCKSIVFWVDNWTVQNKNWTLYSAIVTFVNSPGQIQTISFKYFEPGHSFMSADSFHTAVEKEFKKRKNIYDFEDFVDVINTSGEAITMDHKAFLMLTDDVSQGKYTSMPYRSEVVKVEFRRGCQKIFWKTSFHQIEFISGLFL